jgi:DNA-binding response OmpR family regulator
MKSLKVLIVEDESIVAMEIESYLRHIGCQIVGICASSEETFMTIKEHNTDVILMDIFIEGALDGIETAVTIKEKYPSMEIIFLSANTDTYNIERAISIDPVSYLSKPFNRHELLAALKIAKNRIEKKTHFLPKDDHYLIMDNEFVYHYNDHSLYCCSEMIHLTKRETQLLRFMIDNKNSVITPYMIENEIWPDKETSMNTIRTLIRRLREKLKYKFIETISSRGYKFTLQN